MPAYVPQGSLCKTCTAEDGSRLFGFRIDAPGNDGRRRQVHKHRSADNKPFPHEKAARNALDDYRQELRDGHVPAPDDGTVAGFAAGWVAALPAEGLERSTIKYYREAITRLLPTIGSIPVQELTAQDIDRAYGALLELGRAARTVRASHAAMRKMLAEAVRLGVVGVDVSGRARPPRPKAARSKRFPTWDIDGLGRFLDATADDADAAQWWTAAYTGMRRGELVALRWDDIDLDDGMISVVRAVGEGDGKVVYDKIPKSDAGRRRIELDDDTTAVLREHRRAQLERRLALGGGWRDLGLVFCDIDGSAQQPDRVTDRWRCLARRVAPTLGLQVIRLHDLRHSHATQLLAAGVRPDVVTKRLGHSSVAFTLATYGHVYEGDQRAAMARLLERKAR